MGALLFGNNLRMFNADLAIAIGINESIMLQQLHYLLNPKFNKNLKNDRYWIYNTYQEWKEKEFPFWSEKTIKRTFLSLEKQELVDAKVLSKNSRDRTKWYTINYEKLAKLELVIGTTAQIDPMGHNEAKMGHSNGPKWAAPLAQNGPMSKVLENYQETIQENNTVELASNSTTTIEQPPVNLEFKLTEPCPEQKPKEQPEPLAAEPAKQPKANRNENYWAPVVLSIFAYWQTALNHPKARLDANRGASITKALKLGFSEDDLKKAIDGLSKTPHNLGMNDRGEVYDGLHIVFRSAEQIERFMRNADNPPNLRTKNFTTGEKKQNFIDRHTENMQMMDDITMKYFPEFGKYFGSDKRVAMRNAASNQFVQEMIAHGI